MAVPSFASLVLLLSYLLPGVQHAPPHWGRSVEARPNHPIQGCPSVCQSGCLFVSPLHTSTPQSLRSHASCSVLHAPCSMPPSKS
ncbi:hypothetical protein V8C44DRAFT_62233 [Trichoderma aethiopicum]